MRRLLAAVKDCRPLLLEVLFHLTVAGAEKISLHESIFMKIFTGL
jgi:hypothetical protein